LAGALRYTAVSLMLCLLHLDSVGGSAALYTCLSIPARVRNSAASVVVASNRTKCHILEP